MKKGVNKIIAEFERAQQRKANARYYNVNSIFGNDWAMFFVIIGGRMTGKSYSITDFLCRRKQKLGRLCKNYWLRISESSTKVLLQNKANKLVDPDLVRKYDLELSTRGMDVYNHLEKGEKNPDVFMSVMPLSQFGKLKGQAFYDKDFEGEINIVLDEFQLEKGEKRTSFNILYNFIGMIENIARTTKQKIRIILIGNTLEEASTILKAFDFLPEKFGRFYLKSKRCVIDNLEPTEEYLKDRKGSAADILGGRGMSNYTNMLTKDVSMLYKGPLKTPTAVIRFGKGPNEWFAVWDNCVIRPYKGEKVREEYHIAMRPYLGINFLKEQQKMVIEMYDIKHWKFVNLIAQAYFQDALREIRK